MNAIIVQVNNVRFYCLSITNKQSAPFYKALLHHSTVFLIHCTSKYPFYNQSPCDIAQKIAQIEREDYWSKYSLPKNYQIYLSTYIQEYFRAHQFKDHWFSKHYVNMIVTGVMWKPITIKEINKGSMRGTVTYSNLSSASRQRVALNLENLVMMSAILCSPWTLVQRVRTLAVLFSNSFSPTT